MNYYDEVLDYIDEHAEDLDNGLLTGKLSLVNWLLECAQMSSRDFLLYEAELVYFLVYELGLGWERVLSVWDSPVFDVTTIYLRKDITGDVVLPDSEISAIDCYTFQRTYITSFISQDKNLDKIYRSAFAGCKELTTVEIEQCNFIDREVFSGCESLSKVILPDGLESIGNEAFYNCPSLKVLELPQTIKSIGYHLITGDTKLKIRNLVKSDAEFFINNYTHADISAKRDLIDRLI